MSDTEKPVGSGDSNDSTRNVREGTEIKLTTQLCMFCEEDTAIFQCVECRKTLCGVCKTFHKRQILTKTHTLVELEASTDDQQGTIGLQGECLHEGDTGVHSFCVTCQNIVCLKCEHLQHKAHNVVAKADAIRVLQGLCIDKAKMLATPRATLNEKQTSFADLSEGKVKECNTLLYKMSSDKDRLISMVERIFEHKRLEVVALKSKLEDTYTSLDIASKKVITNCDESFESVASWFTCLDIKTLMNKFRQLKSISNKAEHYIEEFEKFGSTVTERHQDYYKILSQLETHIESGIDKMYPWGGVRSTTWNDNGERIKSLKLLHKTEIDEFLKLPNRITKDGFMVAKDNKYAFVRCENKAEIIPDKNGEVLRSAYELRGYSAQPLSLSRTRHVIVTDKPSLVLIDDRDSLLQSTDIDVEEFDPETLAYVDNNMFAALDSTQKTIRYYSTSNLKTLNTYKLDDPKYPKGSTFIKIFPAYMLVAENGDILLRAIQSDSDIWPRLIRFTRNGKYREEIQVVRSFFDSAYHDSVCLAKGDQVIAAMESGNILRYRHSNVDIGLEFIYEMHYLWGMGIDEDDCLCISYSEKYGKNFIAKYEFVWENSDKI